MANSRLLLDSIRVECGPFYGNWFWPISNGDFCIIFLLLFFLRSSTSNAACMSGELVVII